MWFYAENILIMRRMQILGNYADPHRCILSDVMNKASKNKRYLLSTVSLLPTLQGKRENPMYIIVCFQPDVVSRALRNSVLDCK